MAAGILFFAADFQAGRAEKSAARGDLSTAISQAGRAHTLNPFAPRYLLNLGSYEASAGSRWADVAMWRQSALHLHTLNQRFAPTAAGLWMEATALVAGNPNGSANARAEQLLRQAEELDPHNAQIAELIAGLREAMLQPRGPKN